MNISPTLSETTFKFPSGIILLDKPLGLSSNAALQQVKRILRVKKAGHTGSLDPLATGMLPLCLEQATKFSDYLLNADKQYEVCAQLGVCTTTADAEGEITERHPVGAYSSSELNTILESFSGEIEQMPPMFSAIKQNGKPLYELARQGITVERATRRIQIFSLKLISFENDRLSLFVHCSKGTYIRTLIEDIGRILGCGAYVRDLRRTSVGSYLSSQMITLDQLQTLASSKDYQSISSFILSVGSCLEKWPDVIANEQLIFYLKRGQSVRINNSPTNGWVKIISSAGEFVGIGEIQEDGRVAPRKLIQE